MFSDNPTPVFVDQANGDVNGGCQLDIKLSPQALHKPVGESWPFPGNSPMRAGQRESVSLWRVGLFHNKVHILVRSPLPVFRQDMHNHLVPAGGAGFHPET